MWTYQNGKLLQTTDPTRMRYKTRISARLLEDLREMAEELDTHIGYLLENGYLNLLAQGSIQCDKANRPKDRIEFRTTCDAELLQALKEFAKRQKVNLNDVIEASVAHIVADDVKDGDWRYRIE